MRCKTPTPKKWEILVVRYLGIPQNDDLKGDTFLQTSEGVTKRSVLKAD